MSSWHGLVYPVRPGSEEQVKGLFNTAEAPSLEVRDGEGRTVGRLLGTLAFVGKGVAVRLIEVDGDVREVSAHMGRQPEAWEFQRRLQPHLAVERDLTSPGSMRAFFMDASLECVLDRRNGREEFNPVTGWHGLVYPVRPGSEEQVKDLFNTAKTPSLEVKDGEGRTVGRLLGTLAFVGKGVAVRLIEVDGDVREVSAHMGRQPEAWEFQRQLQPHLAVERDLTSPGSMRAFFMDASLECVLSRHT